MASVIVDEIRMRAYARPLDEAPGDIDGSPGLTHRRAVSRPWPHHCGRTPARRRVLPFSSRSGMLIDGEVPDADAEHRALIGCTHLNEERVAACSKNAS
jgi:hypothetical protein